jgi:hypothetical protein
MDTNTNLERHPEPKPSLPGIGKAIFVIVFFVLVLLLGLSMVHHRFFQGERIHHNGSVGQ